MIPTAALEIARLGYFSNNSDVLDLYLLFGKLVPKFLMIGGIGGACMFSCNVYRKRAMTI